MNANALQSCRLKRRIELTPDVALVQRCLTVHREQERVRGRVSLLAVEVPEAGREAREHRHGPAAAVGLRFRESVVDRIAPLDLDSVHLKDYVSPAEREPFSQAKAGVCKDGEQGPLRLAALRDQRGDLFRLKILELFSVDPWQLDPPARALLDLAPRLGLPYAGAEVTETLCGTGGCKLLGPLVYI